MMVLAVAINEGRGGGVMVLAVAINEGRGGG